MNSRSPGGGLFPEFLHDFLELGRGPADLFTLDRLYVLEYGESVLLARYRLAPDDVFHYLVIFLSQHFPTFGSLPGKDFRAFRSKGQTPVISLPNPWLYGYDDTISI